DSKRNFSRCRRARRARRDDAREASMKEVEAPDQPSKAEVVLLALLLTGVFNFTTLILIATLADAHEVPKDIAGDAATRANLSTFCLLFLAASIHPFARLRETRRR